MQRAQRAHDNPALDTAVEAANALGKPVVVFFAPRPFEPRTCGTTHFWLKAFLDIAEGLAKRNVGFVLRRFPEHSLLKFCDEVKPGAGGGRRKSDPAGGVVARNRARKLKVPLWTVDADVIVPTKLLEKEQYAAFIIRPRLQARLPEFLKAPANPKSQTRMEARPTHTARTRPFRSTNLPRAGRSIAQCSPSRRFVGGTKEGMKRLRAFVQHKLGEILARPQPSRSRRHHAALALPALRPHRATDRCARR